MKRLIFGTAILTELAFCLTGCAVEHTKDTTSEVKKALKAERAVLIDVREAEEWNQGHLEGVKNLPLSELKAGLTPEKLKVFFPTGKIAYLHCAAGRRSVKAADLLKAAGFETRPLQPGYEDLLKAGFSKAK